VGPQRYYLLAFDTALPNLTNLLGADGLHVVATSGGKHLFTNQSLDPTSDKMRPLP
jgi:hypothetical protein